MSTTMERVTQELSGQPNDESYEGIVKNHWDNCKKLASELGLADKDMSPLLLQNPKALLADLLAAQRASLITGLEKKYTQELVHIVRKLNERLQSLGIVFKLYENNNLHVSIYGQEIFRYYLNEICKDFSPIVKVGFAPSVEKLIIVVNSYNENPEKNFFEIEKLKALAENFEKLFIAPGIYYSEITDFKKAEKFLPKKPGLTMIAPHSKFGWQVRLYARNWRGELKIFSLGFTEKGKIIFTPAWWFDTGQVIFNTEKEFKEYDSVADLLDKQKEFLIVRLEIDYPEDLENRMEGVQTTGQLGPIMKLNEKIKNLSAEELARYCVKAQKSGSILSTYESQKSSQKVLRHEP